MISNTSTHHYPSSPETPETGVKKMIIWNQLIDIHKEMHDRHDGPEARSKCKISILRASLMIRDFNTAGAQLFWLVYTIIVLETSFSVPYSYLYT